MSKDAAVTRCGQLQGIVVVVQRWQKLSASKIVASPYLLDANTAVVFVVLTARNSQPSASPLPGKRCGSTDPRQRVVGFDDPLHEEEVVWWWYEVAKFSARTPSQLCSKGASQYFTQKRKCSQGLQRKPSQSQRLSLALQCMDITMIMYKRTLAIPSAEEPCGGPSLHNGATSKRATL